MSDGLTLIIGDDGVAREYNDEYDIVIHCENEEENKKVREIMDAWNSLVHCKDCKYYCPNSLITCGNHVISVEEDDYCSFGESES